MIVERLGTEATQPIDRTGWPYTVPAVAAIDAHGLEFREPVTLGEGFFTVLEAMFTEPGLYLMDEPEAALSFTSCLRLVALLDHLGKIGGQVICASHSPILTATPGADILELGDHGIRRTSWEKLQLVDHWRRFMAKPGLYLRHLIEDSTGR